MPKDKIQRRIDIMLPSNAGSALVETTSDPAPPAIPTIPAPANLTLTTALGRSAVTPTALIAATWDIPDSVTPQRYAIQWSINSSFPDGVTSGMDAPQASATIDGLKPNTLYYVRVAALYRSMQSPWSDAESITTQEDTTPPDSVTSAAGDFSTGDLVLTWTNPINENLKDVRVRVYASNGGTLLREVYSTTGRYVWTVTTNFLDTGGTPDPSVYVVLTARSYNNITSSDVTLTVTKSAPTAPASVSVTTFSSGIIAAIGTGTGIDLDYYLVTLYLSGVAQNTVRTTTRTTIIEASVSGSYTVGVKAYDRFGQASSETMSSSFSMDILTTAELRSGIKYTDSVGNNATTLAVLKDGTADDPLGTEVSYLGSASWRWVIAERPTLDRYRHVTIIAGTGSGYLGTSVDGVTYTYYSGSLGSDGRTLTAVANEAAAQAAAINLPTTSTGRWDLPDSTEIRFIKLGFKSAAIVNLYEFYPRRYFQTDDLDAEVIRGMSIVAGQFTANTLSALSADLGSITAGTVTGATIQTSTSGARTVMSSAANGGLIGYNNSDTYNPSTGTGTYQILWKKTDGKLYWANGIGALGDSGVVFSPVHNGDETKNGLGWQNGGQVQAVVYGDVVVNSMAKVEIKAAYNGVFGTTNPRITMNDYAGTFSGMIEFDSTWTYLKLAERGAYLKYGLLIDGDGSIGYQSGQVYGLQVSNGGINIGTTGAATGELRASGKLYSPAVVLQSDAGDGSATTVPGQLGIVGATNPNLLGLIGFDTTTKQLYIQALESGVAWKNIILANNGGSVGIGSTSPSEKLAVSGNVNISGVYKNAGTQVVGTRKTGWGAPTGTATRTAFATGSVTTAQLAERVKALIDDLTSHGLIGT
ncbi:MAG: fibronectin type III domain-containing protein [Kouleothrix sp.]|jgi:hypothetical protein|nr:fibronectin type III domain-containing protein [Kouleothrix sp.]